MEGKTISARGTLDDQSRKSDYVITQLGRLEREMIAMLRDIADLYKD